MGAPCVILRTGAVALVGSLGGAQVADAPLAVVEAAPSLLRVGPSLHEVGEPRIAIV